MLEYDNSAFYYFALTLLVIYIIPGTWYALSECFLAFFGSGEVGAKARTAAEKQKAELLKKETTGTARLNKTWYLCNLACLLVAWCLLLYLISLVINDGEVSSFDPYQILGIEQGTSTPDIKKAYRKLSLKYHPDKNIGDKLAEEMFMKIAKAYEALTDEAAKENYEKYGNPDGKQALEVSIGLPSIILDNPKVVLVLYLIGMIAVIPTVVGVWYANSKQFGENNIMYTTYQAFYQMMQEGSRARNIPEIMAASAEITAINVPKPGDKEVLEVLYSKFKTDKLMVKPKLEYPVVIRGNLLIHAHVLRMTDKLNAGLTSDLHKMLARLPDLVQGLIEISYQRKWLEASIAAIKFGQHIIQALWTNNHSLQQLPYFGEAEVKHVTKSAGKQVKSLRDYLQLSDEEKTGMSSMTDEQKAEVLRVCSILPHLRVETQLFVEEEEPDFVDDDEDGKKSSNKNSSENVEEISSPAVAKTEQPPGDKIFEQDLVTLRVKLIRENVDEGKKSPPVYAPHFPRTLQESWWIVLTEKSGDKAGRTAEPNIHAFERVTNRSREVVHDIRFMAPPKTGEFEMELQIFSDCYMGLDVSLPIQFTVHPASELPEYQPHPEDLELDNEPTLFEQVMAANVDDDSSDDEDDKEEEEDSKTPPAKNSTAPRVNSSGGILVEDDSGSEEED